MSEMLVPMGFSVKQARNGREAIAVWRQWQPQLIWMDVRMPILGGYEAAERIQNTCGNPGGASCPVIIAMSASSLKEESDKARKHRCHDFMRKPFRMSTMLGLIQTHLEVAFIYESNQDTEIPAPQSPPSQSVLADTMGKIPQGQRDELERATLRINVDKLQTIVTEIAEIYPILAATLKQWVDDYEFDRVLELIQITKEPV
jgi:CheY-like chemotaxis protein